MRGAFVFAAAVIFGCAGPLISATGNGGDIEARKLKNPSPSSATSIAAGQATYQKTCRFCHGPEGKGNGPVAPEGTADLTDAHWTHGPSDGEIFTVIREGAGPDSKMKGFKGRLTDAEIWNLVNYLRTLGVSRAAAR